MFLIDKLHSSYKYVCQVSKHVTINYEKVDSMIESIKSSHGNYWLDSNPYGIMDMEISNIINFLLIYHTIGDYCFWGDPKWEIITENGKMDGSFAMIYLLIQKFKNDKNFVMSFAEFKELLKGNNEIPLIDNRYANLVKMNEVVDNNSFYEMIKGMTCDVDLLNIIVDKFPYFEDVAIYDGREICFYKRAQLLVSDILHVMKVKENINVDYSQLIGCADYKIPQVMRCYGMLDFDEQLAQKIDSKEQLLENSCEEVEIRANTLAVIEYIYEKLDKKVMRMDINDFIWLLGQNKGSMTKPYHRTLTRHY